MKSFMDPFHYVAAMFHFPTESPLSKDAVIKLETTVARSCYKHTNILLRPHTIAANTRTRSTQILPVTFPSETMERSWRMMGAEQLWLYWLLVTEQ